MVTETVHTEATALNRLRTLLLEEEWETHQKTKEELEEIRDLLNNYDQLDDKLEPHFQQHIVYLQDNFPQLFRKSLGKALERQIAESKGEIIEALYPIIGKLISRYIRAEFEKLSKTIDDAQRDFFSLHNWKLRLKAFFTGVSYREMVMQKSQRATLEEVFVIENESGLLLGHFSMNNLLDPDMIAGMLTGIKGFVEHALMEGPEDLESLSYGVHKILVHNAQGVYFANVIDGQVDVDFKTALDKEILSFLEDHPIHHKEPLTEAYRQTLSLHLKEHFYGFNQMDQ